MEPLWLAMPGAIIWVSVLALPWQPWRIREKLEVADNKNADLSDVTVLIPARNEAKVIAGTLASLTSQGKNLKIILVNDQSTDATGAVIREGNIEALTIIEGMPLEAGWTGKLWALQQGLVRIKTDKVLLLDADIQLKSGAIASLREKMQRQGLHLISLMAALRMHSVWEKMLMPAFIYFFKLLYPFHLSNSKSRRIAAAAGGCILLSREALIQTGGFAPIRDKIIDDCALARQFKNAGFRTWVGLSHAAVSHRRYDDLSGIWEMVARTAFTQLRYSTGLLALCCTLLILAFVSPVICLFIADWNTNLLALFSLTLMLISYFPTVRYYSLNPLWTLTLPATGVLYLLMTLTSAQRYWRGVGASWKERKLC